MSSPAPQGELLVHPSYLSRVHQEFTNLCWITFYNVIAQDPEEVIMSKVIEIQKCVICEKSFSGFGNNPEPVEYGGRCCDDCNAGVVIPRRILDYDWDR
jgi:hypothetical protein